jgi:hypothetical protein
MLSILLITGYLGYLTGGDVILIKGRHHGHRLVTYETENWLPIRLPPSSNCGKRLTPLIESINRRVNMDDVNVGRTAVESSNEWRDASWSQETRTQRFHSDVRGFRMDIDQAKEVMGFRPRWREHDQYFIDATIKSVRERGIVWIVEHRRMIESAWRYTEMLL